jgi:hypothetical protein
MFPHTTIYVSSYYYMCPHTTIYLSSQVGGDGSGIPGRVVCLVYGSADEVGLRVGTVPNLLLIPYLIYY